MLDFDLLSHFIPESVTVALDIDHDRMMQQAV